VRYASLPPALRSGCDNGRAASVFTASLVYHNAVFDRVTITFSRATPYGLPCLAPEKVTLRAHIKNQTLMWSPAARAKNPLAGRAADGLSRLRFLLRWPCAIVGQQPGLPWLPRSTRPCPDPEQLRSPAPCDTPLAGRAADGLSRLRFCLRWPCAADQLADTYGRHGQAPTVNDYLAKMPQGSAVLAH
jgi:hypothetical protein